MATSLEMIREKRKTLSSVSEPDFQDTSTEQEEDSMPEGIIYRLSTDIRFYGVTDLTKMLGWSKNTVQKLFNDPGFPSANFGRSKVVEAHALIEYFSVRRCKEEEEYWQGQEVI